MDNTKDIFGERLMEIRKERGETQQELADSIGITQQSLCRYEQGERTANIDFIRKVAKHYNVPADYFLGLSGAKSYNSDLQAICWYTGLSEKSVIRLRERCNLSVAVFPKGQLHAANVTNEIIEHGYLDSLVQSICQLDNLGDKWENHCKACIKEGNYDYGKYEYAHSLSDEMNMLKFNVYQLINSLLFYRDRRYDILNYSSEGLVDEKAFEVLLSKIMGNEDKNNSKHNPPKE